MNKKAVIMLWVGGVLLVAVTGAFLLLRKNDFSNYDASYTWSVDYDLSQKGVLVRGRNIRKIRKDINKLLFAFNLAHADTARAGVPAETTAIELPRLRLLKVERGVASVEILNADTLTEQMGSSGAQTYLAEATYTLTECPGVTAVDFTFPEGDHAMPGLYSRETFSGFGDTAGDPAAGQVQAEQAATSPTPSVQGPVVE